MDTGLAVFLCVYAAKILGGVPGLRLDRTGAALVGAVALCATGTLSPGDAWRAIDVGTIGLLLGLVLVSAQFRLGGFYGSVTRWLAARPTSPERLLLELVLVEQPERGQRHRRARCSRGATLVPSCEWPPAAARDRDAVRSRPETPEAAPILGWREAATLYLPRTERRSGVLGVF